MNSSIRQDNNGVKEFACDIQEYLDADMIVGVHGAGLTHMVSFVTKVFLCLLMLQVVAALKIDFV
jgi:hypothetical protein